MSGRNGDHSRFNRQRKAKLHNRVRMRKLRKTLKTQEIGSGQKSEPKRT